ncbi:MAG: HNH endonuclease [Leptospiraceae bacterium]|nr:HNH endonuclease [Leptospiraceae bacterium]
MNIPNKEYLDLLNEHLSYDVNTGIIIWKKSPGNKCKIGDAAGTLSNGYAQIGLKGKIYRTHRIVWFLYYNSWPKNQIDHINGIRDDNRIENLREVTIRENQQNRVEHRNGALVGTYFNKKAKKWRSQIRINGEHIHLGYYKTEAEAHNSYNSFKKENNL